MEMIGTPRLYSQLLIVQRDTEGDVTHVFFGTVEDVADIFYDRLSAIGADGTFKVYAYPYLDTDALKVELDDVGDVFTPNGLRSSFFVKVFITDDRCDYRYIEVPTE